MGLSEDDNKPRCLLLRERGKNSPGFKSDREKIRPQVFQSRWVCFPQGGMGTAQLMQTSFKMKNDLVWKGATSSGSSRGGQRGYAPLQDFCMRLACVTLLHGCKTAVPGSANVHGVARNHEPDIIPSFSSQHIILS